MSKRFTIVLGLAKDNELATRNHRLLRLDGRSWMTSCKFRPQTVSMFSFTLKPQANDVPIDYMGAFCELLKKAGY